MFFVILLVTYFGRSLVLLFVALGAVQWLTMSRIVRGQVLSLKAQPFVEAARALGASSPGILARHIVPNLLGPVIVYSTLTVPAVMLEEAFLSFLGLGVSPPATSWGLLTAEGASAISVLRTNWWLVVFPGAALSLTLFALNYVGDGLRDALDPKQVRQR
jgi:oligopeptide transport system permease protein